MKLNLKDYVCIVLIILMIALNIAMYTNLPSQMITHWNAYGEADGWSGKDFSLFLIPGLTALLYVLFLAIPKIMVFKKNFKKFQNYYDDFKLLFVGFMFFMNLVIILSNLGYDLPIGLTIGGAVAVLIFYIGHITPHFKRNYFIGIRTPWALSDERVWDKTQKFGGRMLQIVAILIVLAFIFPDYMMLLMIGGILGLLATVFIYSYLEYQKLH